jgi:hypothetical protein
MDEKQFEILIEKLERVLRLLALNLVKEAKGDERVRILSSAKFGGAEIAEMLEMEPNAVNQALYRLRRKGKEGSKGSQAEQETERGAKGAGKTPSSEEDTEGQR